MTRRIGLIGALCVACGNDPSGTGSSESSGSSSGADETSSSSTTMVMTTTPPTTTMTTQPPDTGEESSSGEPPCTDPYMQGELERHPLYQLEEGAPTIFTDIGVIAGDVYLAGSAAQSPDEPRVATLYIIGLNGLEEALVGDAMHDVEVDRLAISADAMSSRMITQIDGSTVEVRDPGDFFNVTGTYQEMGARTRLFDAVILDDAIWGVGYAAGMLNNYGLVAQSLDGGVTWMMTSTFDLGPDQAAEARAVAYHEAADSLVIAGIAADADLVLGWHVRVGALANPSDTEVLETIAEGSARTVEVSGDAIYVGGDVGGSWRVRMAPSIGEDFVDLDDGSAITATKSSVVDLAVGPGGELFALGAVTDEKTNQTLMVLRMCADPSLGQACWVTLIEPDQLFVGESTYPTRLLVDEDGVWITGSVVDMDEELGNEGALFRLACEE